MTSAPGSAGELLQWYGPDVHRLLRRQFPSLPDDVVDDVVVEAVARVWKRWTASPPSPAEPGGLFPLVLTAARRRAIDHLRYSLPMTFTSPAALAQLAAARAPNVPASTGLLRAMVADLQHAISTLDPLDQRIIEASVIQSPDGDWTKELALQLIREEAEEAEAADHPEQPADESSKLPRLRGKLRVRKLRAVEKLRKAMREKGYEIPFVTG